MSHDMKKGDYLVTRQYEGFPKVECCIFAGKEGVVLQTINAGVIGNMERYYRYKDSFPYSQRLIRSEDMTALVLSDILNGEKL